MHFLFSLNFVGCAVVNADCFFFFFFNSCQMSTYSSVQNNTASETVQSDCEDCLFQHEVLANANGNETLKFLLFVILWCFFFCCKSEAKRS